MPSNVLSSPNLCETPHPWKWEVLYMESMAGLNLSARCLAGGTWELQRTPGDLPDPRRSSRPLLIQGIWGSVCKHQAA